MKKILISGVAAAALVGTVYAGTFNPTETTIASELSSTEAADLNVSQKIDDGNYTASLSSPSSVANPSVELTFASSNDDMTVEGMDSNLSLVEVNSTGGFGPGSKIIAQYSQTANDLTLVFDRAGSTADVAIVTEKQYVFREIVDVNDSCKVGSTVGTAGCNIATLSEGTMELNDYQGAVSASLKIYSQEGTNRDSATAALLSSGAQMSADIVEDSEFNGQIDSSDAYKSFRLNGVGTSGNAGDANDTVSFYVNVASKDQDAFTSGADDLTINLALSSALNDDAEVDVNGTACTVATDKMSVSCEVEDVVITEGGRQKYTIQIGNEDSAITSSTFTYDIQYNFSASGATDYASANVLDSGSAGEWTYYGYQATIPYMETGTAASYVKLNNDSDQVAYVYWTVTDTLGCKETNVQAGNVNVSSFQTYSATGDIAKQQANIFNVADIITAANAMTPTNASSIACEIGNKVRLDVLVTTNREDVTGVAMQQLTSGKDRIIPIMTREAVDYDGSNIIDSDEYDQYKH
jgi:hypothetical protein